MLKNDRTLIANLLLPYFPAMKDATSQEWQDFLNGITGLAIDDQMSNGEAFDKWRQALATDQGLPVWGYTPDQQQERAQRVALMLAAENKRRAEEGETLLALKAEAP